MLRVVQPAAWDWAPPHMSGYPHPPPPCHRGTRRLMPTVNPSSRTTKTCNGPPIRRCRGAPLRLRRILVQLVGYTEDDVWDHMLAPTQELQRASLRKANLSHLIPLVPRCVPLDSSGSANRL